MGWKIGNDCTSNSPGCNVKCLLPEELILARQQAVGSAYVWTFLYASEGRTRNNQKTIAAAVRIIGELQELGIANCLWEVFLLSQEKRHCGD